MITARILAWASQKPDAIALSMGEARLSYGELKQQVEQVAAAAHAVGLKPRDVALLFMPQGIEAVICFFGLMHAGIIPSLMPLPSAKQEPERYWAAHASLLDLIAPAAIVGPHSHLEKMREAGLDRHALRPPQSLLSPQDRRLQAHGDPGDIALLQHSSGTTALKKGVALSHRAVAAQVDAYAAAIKASPDDVVVSWLPMYHDMGLIACTVMPLMLGQHVVMLDPFAWVSDPQRLFSEITRHRGTLVWLPNFAFELLAKTVKPEPRFDLSSMRAFINCSEPCKPASFDNFHARFSACGLRREAMQVCYAMAETVFGVSQTNMEESPRVLQVSPGMLAEQGRIGPPCPGELPLPLLSAGRAIAGIRASIVDDEGSPLPEDHVGEIEIDGAFLFDGYYKRDALTHERFRNGRYRTRDIGFLHDGELYVLGRSDDLIIVHGRNYFAHEIEAVANDIAGLKPGRNVAIPVFNELLASQEAVLIAEADGDVHDHVELKRRIKSQVTQVMGLELRDVSIVPQGWLLKTSSGKISRSANKDKYLQPRTKEEAKETA